MKRLASDTAVGVITSFSLLLASITVEVLTRWFNFGTAVLGFTTMCYTTYRVRRHNKRILEEAEAQRQIVIQKNLEIQNEE